MLIDKNGEAILCDFGLSRHLHEKTRTRTMIQTGGRFRYIAPEISLGADKLRTDQAVDIYAFGMCVYEIGTLNPPFSHLNELAAMWQAVTGNRPSFPASLGGLGSAGTSLLSSWLTKMWDSDPKERPSAATIRNALSIPCDGWSGYPESVTMTPKTGTAAHTERSVSQQTGTSGQVQTPSNDNSAPASTAKRRSAPSASYSPSSPSSKRLWALWRWIVDTGWRRWWPFLVVGTLCARHPRSSRWLHWYGYSPRCRVWCGYSRSRTLERIPSAHISWLSSSQRQGCTHLPRTSQADVWRNARRLQQVPRHHEGLQKPSVCILFASRIFCSVSPRADEPKQPTYNSF